MRDLCTICGAAPAVRGVRYVSGRWDWLCATCQPDTKETAER